MKDDGKRINRLVSIPPKYYSDIEEVAKEYDLTVLKAGRLCMLIGVHLFKEYRAMFEEFRKNKNLDKII